MPTEGEEPTMPLTISQADLAALLDSDDELGDALDRVERSLLDRHQGEAGHAVFADLPLASDNAFRVMGSTAEGSVSTVRVFPDHTNQGARHDTAFTLVLDPSTGALVAILAGDDLNTLRTSVPAGVGARHLAPEGARTLGVLGSSTQARGHARAICRALPGIQEVLVWSPTAANREAFAEEHTARFGFPVRPCATAEEAVSGADVITAAGNTPGGVPAYEDAWVRPGALAISMTRSAPPELRARARNVAPTRRRPQLVAIGFVGRGAPKPGQDPEGVVELADVITGTVPARVDPDQPVVFELANIYLWDQPIAAWALDWATRHGLGSTLELTASASSSAAAVG
jgi:ornithine cyclodeaminase/alanine dehydrogenase-like protein (mu-crystallin family)